MQRQYGIANISDDYIASLGCERCRTKKTKDLDEEVLKKNFNHTIGTGDLMKNLA